DPLPRNLRAPLADFERELAAARASSTPAPPPERAVAAPEDRPAPSEASPVAVAAETPVPPIAIPGPPAGSELTSAATPAGSPTTTVATADARMSVAGSLSTPEAEALRQALQALVSGDVRRSIALLEPAVSGSEGGTHAAIHAYLGVA